MLRRTCPLCNNSYGVLLDNIGWQPVFGGICTFYTLALESPSLAFRGMGRQTQRRRFSDGDIALERLPLPFFCLGRTRYAAINTFYWKQQAHSRSWILYTHTRSCREAERRSLPNPHPHRYRSPRVFSCKLEAKPCTETPILGGRPAPYAALTAPPSGTLWWLAAMPHKHYQ